MDFHPENKISCYILHVKGLVQGVGFRPFIYKIAIERGLKGWVINRTDGVIIKIEETREKTEEFRDTIMDQSPPAAIIHHINIKKSDPEHFDSFKIRKSEAFTDEITLVSPDISVCPDCLEDLKKQKHRIDYPFINCTNCGPRFSIIRELPYDRPKTTMDIFKMCPDCENEYKDILDRRFHAQPIACNNCGPIYTLRNNREVLTDLENILDHLSRGIEDGKVYAIKGLGGYNLICDALNTKAVDKLRKIKTRENKPFALMAGSLNKAHLFAHINKKEEDLLEGWQRPIVLLKRRNDLAEEACNGLDRIGIMLAYMPFHHLLFERIQTPALVMTSGNLSDEPIIISNEEAKNTFGGKVDAIVEYNRDIHNRVDDSLVKVSGNRPMILRRSRGYAPSPILTDLYTEGILAVGAELVNSFCIGKGNLAIMSPYIGDLKDYENLKFFEETYEQYRKLFKFSPELIVADLHPSYLSTQFAKTLSKKANIPLIQVQHHHSHIVSVMLEKHIHDNKVIGVCMDGMGSGYNKEIWGAEIFTAGRSRANRMYCFKFLPMPGGDQASHEPWRMALSYLYDIRDLISERPNLSLFQDIPEDQIATVNHMLEQGINCPMASSAGRLFDAVAAILGISYYNNFQAEAPMKLESLIVEGEDELYPLKVNSYEIDFSLTIISILNDLASMIPPGIISTRFHNTIVDLIVRLAIQIRKETGLGSVVLSGGTFQNSYLCVNSEIKLLEKGFKVYLSETIPANDQGIAAGQMGIAAEMRKQGLIPSIHA